MDAMKANDKTSALIAKREQQMERTMKKLKDCQNELVQLKSDNIIMRQDISTYQCIIEEKLDISKQCDKMIQTIDLRQKRLQRLENQTDPDVEEFLGGLIKSMK